MVEHPGVSPCIAINQGGFIYEVQHSRSKTVSCDNGFLARREAKNHEISTTHRGLKYICFGFRKQGLNNAQIAKALEPTSKVRSVGNSPEMPAG